MNEQNDIQKINERIAVTVYMDEAAKQYRRVKKRKWALRQLIIALGGALTALVAMAGLCAIGMIHPILLAILSVVAVSAASARCGFLYNFLKK